MSSIDRAPRDSSQVLCSSVSVPLIDILTELRLVLGSLHPTHYTQRMSKLFAHSTIGGHVRHCLDHVRALVDGRETGTIDYDRRERETPIQSDPVLANHELEHLIHMLTGLAEVDAEERVAIEVMPTRDGGNIRLFSTVGRELAFVLSHTIHHNATIRGMVVSLGLPVPASLGYAPSTLAHNALMSRPITLQSTTL